jgi:two-component system cell cycle sensor histidine kinase/response regulator CckA
MGRLEEATSKQISLPDMNILFEQAAVGIAQIDTNTGRFLWINKKYSEIIGYNAQEILSLDYMILTYPEDLARDLANMELLKSGRLREFSMEKRLFRKDKSVVWVNLTVSSAWPAGETPTCHIAVIEDISVRKLTDIALQALSFDLARLSGEDFFREACRCMARLLDVEMAFVGQIVQKGEPYICSMRLWSGEQMHPQMEFSVARTPCEHVIGKSEVLFTENIRVLFPDDLDLAALGAESYAAVPVFDNRGAPLGHVGIMSRRPLKRDNSILAIVKLFSVRIAAELERQQSETRFHDLFEFAPDGVLIVDPGGVIHLANLQAAELFRCRREELIGLSVEQLMPESIRSIHEEHRREFHKQGSPRMMGARRAPLYAERRDGSTFAVDVSLSPMRSGRGPLVVVSIRDVTERVQSEELRQRLEAQLRQSQKMEAIGTLAGGIAHDFNNILAMITANTSLAREDVNDPSSVMESLDEIEMATARASELVGQILAFSRKQAPDQRLVSMRSLLEETSLLLRAVIPAGIVLSVECNAAPSVLANVAQLQQVLVNLCTNAWHALEGRAGEVGLVLDEVSEMAPGFPASLAPGRYARITVRDNGKGINAADLERIFEPFFTTKETGKGSGLGLSVVHGIVQAHGGFISVESQPERGATFMVYIPSSKDLAPVEAPPTPARTSTTGGRILFLDDEPGLVTAAQRTLSRRGYVVDGFVHPRQALEALQKEPAGFDLVISDFNMPGLSGLDVLQAVSARWPSLPVVVISGHLDDVLRARLWSAGAKAILEKPYSTLKLLETIQQILNPA